MQLQLGVTKALPLGKQETACSVSNESAKCSKYRNWGTADVRNARAIAVPRGLGKLNFPVQACPWGPASVFGAAEYD
jgi:hypothetical protein